jgi:hypothetical protein
LRHSLLVAIALGAVAIVSCRDGRDPTSPIELLKERPKYECTLDASQCDALRRGINHLKQHSNPTCNSVGEDAENRYDAPTWQMRGYKDSPSSWGGSQMGVDMYTTDNGQTWWPTNGYIQVSQGFPGSNGTSATIGGLIAHEEGAHMGGLEGPDHNTGYGAWFQSLCGQE